MLNCGLISNNLALAACQASVAGVENYVYLVNFTDWEDATVESDGNVISSLTLASGAYAYKYESKDKSFETDCTLNKGTYQNTFEHKLVGRVFVRTQETKDELIKLAAGRVVAIVLNKDKNSDEARWELFGADNGLVMSELTSPSTDSDGVLYNFTLSSDENAQESSLPMSIYSTDLATTTAMIEALVSA